MKKMKNEIILEGKYSLAKNFSDHRICNNEQGTLIYK